MAVDYLSSLNVGSGLNTTEIIDALVEAERAPRASESTQPRKSALLRSPASVRSNRASKALIPVLRQLRR